MSDIQQLQRDVHFVREIANRTERGRRTPVAIYWVWALYVLIGYTLVDHAPAYAGPFFTFGWFVCMALSAVIGWRLHRSADFVPRQKDKMLFWIGGGLLIFCCLVALSETIPAVRGQVAGQIGVLMIGLFYFLGGVHYDRNFLWLGPVICACGIAVGFVPREGWTALGVIFALGLVVPTFFPGKTAQKSPVVRG